MKLELTSKEQILLLDSIYTRLKNIDKLVESFDNTELAQMYLCDKEILINLQNKLQGQYETEAV